MEIHKSGNHDPVAVIQNFIPIAGFRELGMDSLNPAILYNQKTVFKYLKPFRLFCKYKMTLDD